MFIFCENRENRAHPIHSYIVFPLEMTMMMLVQMRLDEVFLEEPLEVFFAMNFTLLLVPFQSKLVNFLTPGHSQSLKTYRK